MVSKELIKYNGKKTSELDEADQKTLGLITRDGRRRSHGEIETIVESVGLVDDRTDDAKRRNQWEF
jgi:hypothetical protein